MKNIILVILFLFCSLSLAFALGGTSGTGTGTSLTGGGGGSGSGTVSSGTTGQIAVYPGNGTTVSGQTPVSASGDVSVNASGVFTVTGVQGSAVSAPIAANTGAVVLAAGTPDFTGTVGIGTTVPLTPAILDVRGAVTYNGMISNGTKFTASGCSNSTTVGGAVAGKFTSGTTGACTVVITLNGATGLAAPNGWACSASDITTPANLIDQSASTTTTATITGTTVSGDVIIFQCQGF